MLNQQKRYYLNNISKKEAKITLSTQRNIKPMSSLPLNNKDVVIFKELKAARKGRPSLLDNLKLSTIPIEKDANYLANVAKVAANNELNNPENKDVKDFLDGATDKVPDGTSNISEEEAAKLEAEAMMQLEQKAKEEAAKLEAEAMMQLEQKAKEEAAKLEAEALAKEEAAKLEAIAKEKAKIAKKLQKEAAKDGKTYDEESLAKAVEEAYAAIHKED